MKNTIISYQSLQGDLKNAFKNWLRQKNPDLVSFPYKGEHVKGYIFDYQTCKYLIVMYLSNTSPENLGTPFVVEEF